MHRHALARWHEHTSISAVTGCQSDKPFQSTSMRNSACGQLAMLAACSIPRTDLHECATGSCALISLSTDLLHTDLLRTCVLGVMAACGEYNAAFMATGQ